jgi:hypothetical protein
VVVHHWNCILPPILVRSGNRTAALWDMQHCPIMGGQLLASLSVTMHDVPDDNCPWVGYTPHDWSFEFRIPCWWLKMICSGLSAFRPRIIWFWWFFTVFFFWIYVELIWHDMDLVIQTPLYICQIFFGWCFTSSLLWKSIGVYIRWELRFVWCQVCLDDVLLICIS